MSVKFKYKIAKLILLFVSKTWRFTVKGNNPKETGIIAFWHGNMLPVWRYFSKQSPIAVVSQSQDGELLSDLLASWGYRLIRGSSSKGGKEALEEIVETAKNNLLLLTPDGPRGPYHEFKPGAVIASQRNGKNLYLCRVEVCCKYVFKKSWDKFILPLPFAKIGMDIIQVESIHCDAGREEIDEIIMHCQKLLNNEL